MSGLTWHARTRVLVDENGTESGGVDAQIPVTDSVDASGYETCFKVGPPKLTFGCSGCLLVAVALGLGLDALGVGVGLSGFVSFRWGPTTEEAWAPTQELAVIRRSLDGSSLAVSVAIQGVSC